MRGRRLAGVAAVVYLVVALVLTLGRPTSWLSDDVRATSGRAADEVPVPAGVRDRVSAPGRPPMTPTAQHRDVVVNVVLLAPLGALLPLVTRRWWVILVAPLAVTVVIESLQATVFTHRYAQPSDVVLNTVGAWLASAIVAGGLALRRR